jgi:hypothetical protein
MKHIVILSWKSSGSSALYRRFVTGGGGRGVSWTPHFKNETLYWTKAASILGLDQASMLDSVVPVTADRAERELSLFLGRNLGEPSPAVNTKLLLFEGWRRLCLRHAPLLIEKSPHHLAQRAALDLMMQFDAANPDIEVRYVGLVRNPMDSLYSAYRRWGTIPEMGQHEWALCYLNLREMKARLGERLVIARYEDLAANPAALEGVAQALGIALAGGEAARLHARAIGKWRADRLYGFELEPAVAEIAAGYGYAPEELANSGKALWPATRNARRAFTVAISPLKQAYALYRERGRRGPALSGRAAASARRSRGSTRHPSRPT